MHIIISPMRDLPVGYRIRLRELTIGPVAWGLWSLTFHDGSTWAALAIEDKEIIGWACVTQEYDTRPMIGAYVQAENRKQGVAPLLVTTLCMSLLGKDVLSPGDTLMASTWRWDKYYELLESVGLVCEEWS